MVDSRSSSHGRRPASRRRVPRSRMVTANSSLAMRARNTLVWGSTAAGCVLAVCLQECGRGVTAHSPLATRKILVCGGSRVTRAGCLSIPCS